MALRKSTKAKTTKSDNSKTKSKAKRETSAEVNSGDLKPQIKSEAVIIADFALSILLAFCIFSDSAGAFGALINKLFLGLFGIGAYVLPFAAMLGCVFAGFKKFKKSSRLKNNLVCILFLAFISIFHVMYLKKAELDTSGLSEYIKHFAENGSSKNGGVIGAVIGGLLVKTIGVTGAYVVLCALVIICFIIITERSVFELLSSAAAKTASTAKKLNSERKRRQEISRTNVKAPNDASFDEFRNRITRNDKNFNRKLNWEKDDLLEYEQQKELVEANPELYGFAPDDAAEAPVHEILEMSGIHLNRRAEVEEAPEELLDSMRNDILIENYDEENFDDIEDKPPFEQDETGIADEDKIIKITDYKNNIPTTPVKEKATPINSVSNEFIDYVFPPLELMNTGDGSVGRDTKSLMLKNAQKLEDTLKSFGVIAKVVQINKGPTVTRYELTPDSGVKVSRIVGLADDIALNLASDGIRIEAPVPGKSVVGIEVPNRDRTPVFLREVLESDEFRNFESKVAFGVGKDIGGSAIVADISDMPHLLIAGATGAGKSVCINTLIMSILYKASPNEVKLILIDPKVVELGVYDGIPHLLRSVVTDPKEAANALNWGVREMNNRYNLFKEENVRDLKGYNSSKAEKFEFDAILPKIVIIIDELSDLMMTAPKDVEDSIMRLAQKARAAGIHLVLATQRPSVDVITGVIKANIPSRLAFAVSSGTDSRTILDMVGAEKLLGKGDMLFSPRDIAKPVRVQGAFVSDKEVEKIVEFVKEHSTVEYDTQIAEEIITASKIPVGAAQDGNDDLYEEVLEFVLTKKKVSVSMLQRQFRIGYNRAARLMDTLEAGGVVGPESANTKDGREVLMGGYEGE